MVRYKYEHRAMPNRRHTPLDWVGLFKVVDSQATGGGEFGDDCDDVFRMLHERSQRSNVVATPASRRAREKRLRQKRRAAEATRAANGVDDGSLAAGVKPSAKGGKAGASSGGGGAQGGGGGAQGGRPGSAAAASVASSLSRPMSAAEKRHMLYELQAREEERKAQAAAKAQALAAARAAADPLSSLMDPTLNFGDEEVTEAHKEVMVGWSLVPPDNEGSVAFEGLPTEAGHYRLRYFVHGSQCALGKPADVYARLVDIELDAPGACVARGVVVGCSCGLEGVWRVEGGGWRVGSSCLCWCGGWCGCARHSPHLLR